MKKFYCDVDVLIKGINEVISKNRCLFLDSEIILLQDAVKALEDVKQNQNKKFGLKFDTETILMVVETVFRIFMNGN